MISDNEILSVFPYFITKIVVSTICGMIIGMDRQIKNKVAGVRTFILISVGCSIYTSISFLISNNNIDPSRIISQIITGVGFLGAGVIFKLEDKVIGVTTAAFIWCISAIGILCGLGLVWTPIILSFGLLSISLLFELLEPLLKKIKKNESRD